MPKKENLTNQIFGLVQCIEPAPSRNGKTYWLCRCTQCGKEKIIQTSHLKDGRTQSCGCGCLQQQPVKIIENRKCEICGKEFNVTGLGQSRKYCYDCSPSYTNNQERAKSITALRKAMKQQAVKIKGGKCERCGYNKCIGALQFHHKNPEEKSFGLASSGNVHSWQDYLNEVMKCELLCANCHAEEHYLD